MINLPTDLLRSAVAIVEAGSMARASARVFLTPQALSMQIKRLEDILQAPIFYRTGRGLVPTPAGEALVAQARAMLAINDALVGAVVVGAGGPVRLGMIQDFADSLLSGILAQLIARDPAAQLSLRVGSSDELKGLLADDRLDAVLCIEGSGHPAVVHSAALHWFGDPALLDRPSLPLAVLEKHCVFRTRAIDALVSTGRAHHVLLETPSLPAIFTAVDAGLAITARAAVPGQTGRPGATIDTLPDLGMLSFALHVRPDIGRAAMRAVDMVRHAIASPQGCDPDPAAPQTAL